MTRCAQGFSALTLAAVLAAPAAVAGPAPAPAMPLHFWHGLNGAAAAWLDGVAQRAAAAGGPPVIVQGDVDVEAALFRQDEELAVPDVALVASNLVGLSAELALSPVPRDGLTGVAPRFRATVQRSGIAYGVPLFASDTLLLFRNTALAAEPPATLAQVLAGGPARLAWPLPIPFFFVPLMTATGAWQPDGDGATFRFPAAAFGAALAALRQVAAASGEGPDCAIGCASARFLRGEAAFLVGLAAERREARARLGPRLALSVLPPLDAGGGAMRPLAGSYALVFPNHALTGPRGAELRRFAARFLRPEEQRRLLAETGRLPVAAAAAAEAERSAQGDDLVVVKAMLASVPLPNGRATSVLWPTLRKLLRAQLSAPLPDPAGTMTRLFAAAMGRFTWEPVPSP